MSKVNPIDSPLNTASVPINSDRPSMPSPGKSTSLPASYSPGSDDGWDSASSTSWATELVEANETARKQAWYEHQDRLERSFCQERTPDTPTNPTTAAAEIETPDAEKLAGEVTALRDPIYEAQAKIGYRSLKQSDTALQHQPRPSQSSAVDQLSGDVPQAANASQASADGHTRQ